MDAVRWNRRLAGAFAVTSCFLVGLVYTTAALETESMVAPLGEVLLRAGIIGVSIVALRFLLYRRIYAGLSLLLTCALIDILGARVLHIQDGLFVTVVPEAIIGSVLILAAGWIGKRAGWWEWDIGAR